jgi:hypothetical protein
MSAYAFILFFLTTFAFTLVYYALHPLVLAGLEYYFMNYQSETANWLNNLLLFIFNYSPLLFIVFNTMFWLKYASTQRALER